MPRILLLVTLALIATSVISAQSNLIFWEEEKRLTYDNMTNFYTEVESQDSFVHVVWGGHYPLGYMRSLNFGSSWSDPVFLSDTSWGSYHLCLSARGDNVYLTWNTYYGIGNYLHFRKSTDNGLTWDSLQTLGPSRTYIGMDVKDDTIFIVANVDEDTMPYGQYIIRSYDGGTTWQPYHLITNPRTGYKPQVIYNEGILHLVFQAGQPDLGIYYKRSYDQGETWGQTILLSDTLNPKCPKLVKNKDGLLFLAWTDNKYSSGFRDDIVFRKSTDNGETWTPEQVLTWSHNVDLHLDLFATENDVYIVYPKHVIGVIGKYPTFFQMSDDLGESWELEEKISDPGDTVTQLNQSVSASSDRVYVVWHDYRGGPMEAYFLRGVRQYPGIRWQEEARYPNSLAIQCFPNPFFTQLLIKPLVNKNEIISISIFDIQGKMIKEINAKRENMVWNGRDEKGYQVPSGIYYIIFETRHGEFTKKLVKIR